MCHSKYPGLDATSWSSFAVWWILISSILLVLILRHFLSGSRYSSTWCSYRWNILHVPKKHTFPSIRIWFFLSSRRISVRKQVILYRYRVFPPKRTANRPKLLILLILCVSIPSRINTSNMLQINMREIPVLGFPFKANSQQAQVIVFFDSSFIDVRIVWHLWVNLAWLERIKLHPVNDLP